MSRLADPVASGCRQLGDLLEQSLAEYVALRALVARRRDAVRTANMRVLDEVLQEERQATARIADLDRRRTEVAASLAKRTAVAQPTVTAIAAKAPEGERERLLVLAARLRDEIEACRRESSVVRHAAEMLAQHVSGILQTVHAAFGATKTYGRAGRLAVATPIRTVDLKS